jgi:hypothetical protein
VVKGVSIALNPSDADPFNSSDGPEEQPFELLSKNWNGMMVFMHPFSSRSTLAAILLLTACATPPPFVEGHFYLGSKLVKMEELKSRDIYALLSDDWAGFDKHFKDTSNAMTGRMGPVNWHFQMTPPIPTNWPPQRLRSVTYYAYGQNQEFRIHGPALGRSAPWAKVVLTEGAPADKVMLATSIGREVHGEGSVALSTEQANRKIQIIKDGEARLSSFVGWRAIPDDAAAVKAIREYYCQWALTDGTANLIKGDHRAFFEWLSCPPRTWIPVLPPSG